MIRICVAVLLWSTGAAHGATLAASSERGERLFTSQSCIHCHSVNGKGGHVGPDLGRRVDRDYTPATLASLMWNHAPTMWSAMRERGIPAQEMDEQAAADLFAYFYSARFFDRPGDAGRGKRLFTQRNCSQCHGLTEAKAAGAKPVSEWQSLGHPIELADAMWNHASDMRARMEGAKLEWVRLSGQDLSDILVYLRNLPSTRQKPGAFDINAGDRGQEIFTSKGCAGCHTGSLALPSRMKGKTLTDIAAEMWNHEPAMAARMGTAPPRLDSAEMRELVSYLWAQRFFEDSGDANRGKHVFVSKKCAACHEDSASDAPKLSAAARPFSGVTMVAALWRHGPAMQQRFQERGLAWPRFDNHDMSDLIAYLNASGASDKKGAGSR
jgi:mono/diheme cytochrome c family protein